MTLSIGVVTNQFQTFEHTGQISELAAEMKTYAKTLPGSVYVVDRRHQLPTLETASAEDAETLVGAGQRRATDRGHHPEIWTDHGHHRPMPLVRHVLPGGSRRRSPRAA